MIPNGVIAGIANISRSSNIWIVENETTKNSNWYKEHVVFKKIEIKFSVISQQDNHENVHESIIARFIEVLCTDSSLIIRKKSIKYC